MKPQSLKLLLIFTTSAIALTVIAPQTSADSLYKNWRSFGKINRIETDKHQERRQDNASTRNYQPREMRPSRRYSEEKESNTRPKYSKNKRKNEQSRQHKQNSGSFSRSIRDSNDISIKRQHARQHRSNEHHDDRRNADNNYPDKQHPENKRNRQNIKSAERQNDDFHLSERQIKHSDHNKHNGRSNGDRHRHQPDYPRKKEVLVTHRHKPRPNYRIYNRQKHVYYRTPWYNTRFVAPVHFHYHRVGHRVHVLPKPYVHIVVGGFPYFYYYGTFYKPLGSTYVVVSAPIGAVVTSLPVGFAAFSIGLSTYYYVNDTYYVWDEPRDAYVVVEKPQGADEALELATKGRLFVYPNKGQDEKQQAKDRYECHRWAVSESDVDPSDEDEELTSREHNNYKRAISACLEGRDYTVK